MQSRAGRLRAVIGNGSEGAWGLRNRIKTGFTENLRAKFLTANKTLYRLLDI